MSIQTKLQTYYLQAMLVVAQVVLCLGCCVLVSSIISFGSCVYVSCQSHLVICVTCCFHGVGTESSEGLLGGQKPPVQLLFRAVDAQGQRVRSIPPLLSDEFLVNFTH